MGLPYLYAVPETQDDWRKWSFNHAANHYDIVNAIQEQKNVQVEQFILDPMDPTNLGIWFYWHQTMHDQANAVLGTSGYNFLSLDWTNPDQFQEWLRLNGDNHVRMSAALEIG